MRVIHVLGLAIAIAACADPPRDDVAPRAEAVDDCGGGDLPDCPTQAFMKATMQAHLRTKDYARLADAFELLARQAPDSYDGWRAIAAEGARAARDRDDAAVGAVCKRCHDTHRERFKRELRRQRLFDSGRTAQGVADPSRFARH